MIWIVTGKIGGGKTVYCMIKALEKLAAGGHVLTNIEFNHDNISDLLKSKYKRKYFPEQQYKFIDFENRPEFQNDCVQGTRACPSMAIIDEAHLFYPAHGHAKQDVQLSRLNSFLSQSRKVNIDLFFICQDISILYHRIKAQTEHRIHCLDARKKTLPFLGRVPGAGLMWVEKDMKSDMVLSNGTTPFDDRIFGCYDSFQMYDTQMRSLQSSMPVHTPLDNKISVQDSFRDNRFYNFLFPNKS